MLYFKILSAYDDKEELERDIQSFIISDCYELVDINYSQSSFVDGYFIRRDYSVLITYKKTKDKKKFWRRK